MKKVYLLLSILVLVFLTFEDCDAQNPELIGMTFSGGTNSIGTIFKINADGSGFQTVYSFASATGYHPYGTLLQNNDGMLYGMTSAGGAHLSGTLFRFDPVNYTYTDLFDFNTSSGIDPYGNLVQASDGKLYGMTAMGGTKSDGVIFRFNPADSSYSKLFDFVDSIGAFPKGGLIEASDGKLYGVASVEGANNKGSLFSFDPSTHTCSKKFDFSASNGVNPYGNLVEAGDGIFLGTTRVGGSHNAGVLFKFNTADSSYVPLVDFAGGSQQSPCAGLTMAANGKLYGMTLQGGSRNAGSVYSFDTAGNIYNTVLDFDSVNGASPQFNTLMQPGNGKLYGMTTNGGINNKGVLFTIDPANNNTYTKLIDFDGTNGSYPYGSLLELGTFTAVAHPDEKNSFAVYPNPATDRLAIHLKDSKGSAVLITNVMGEVIMTAKQSSLNIESLPAGIYFVQVISKDGSWVGVEKFVKE